MMAKILRTAVLVDLSRETGAGGHVKYWERLAQACVRKDCPVDMTIYFLGVGADHALSPQVRYRFLKPVFSTARLKFLSYVPAHTDLAHFHPALARELDDYDVLHTTGAYFSFAQTAEKIAIKRNKPLVTSFHTDTPAYAEIFTRQALRSVLGESLGGGIDSFFNVSARQRLKKEARLKEHLKHCAAVLALRPEDARLAGECIEPSRVNSMRLGVDKTVFAPRPEARAEIEKEFGIDPGRFMVLFVGRVDIGKNMPLLMEACRKAIQKGVKLHMLVAGTGPLEAAAKNALGKNITLTGTVSQEKLARFYAGADCLAMASDIEIGGLIGGEALACGLPVLSSKKTGVAALCGGTSAVIEVESDVAAWIDALTLLEADRERQKTMRAEALKFRDSKIVGWDDVFCEDFLPVWQSVA